MSTIILNSNMFVPPGHELLSTKLEAFSFTNPPVDPQELVDELARIMVEKNGLGLAANQVGLPYRVFVMRSEPVIACFNPRIISVSEQTIISEEGCLTYPNLFVKIKRPGSVMLRFADVSGNMITREMSGITARVALHELDHLNGIDYLKRASPIHLTQAKRRTKLLKRKLKRQERMYGN